MCLLRRRGVGVRQWPDRWCCWQRTARLTSRPARPPACLPAHLPACSSRLGSRVTLSKELDGTVIALGQIYPWKSL